MTEVELKAALTEQQAGVLPTHLFALGFRERDKLRETDVYFNGDQNRDFRKTDEGLRLRTCRNLITGATETLMTYKGPKTDLRSSTRKEYETTVGDLNAAQNLLQALGFAPVYTVDKTRQTFSRGNITACLDRVENLGSYLELEILQESENQDEAVDRLLMLLDRLEISREALSRESYLECLIASATSKKSSYGI